MGENPRETLRTELRDALVVSGQNKELTGIADAVLDHYGADDVLAVVQDRTTHDVFVFVEQYEDVFASPGVVWRARVLPPIRVRVGSYTTFVLEIDRLERDCAGYAWDLSAVGMLARGAQLVFSDGAVTEERLADCVVGAQRIVARLALDRMRLRFETRDFTRTAVALAGVDPPTYEQFASYYDHVFSENLRLIAAASGDAFEGDGVWEWADDRTRRFSRGAYSFLFTFISQLREVIRTPQLSDALGQLQERLGVS